MEQIVETSMARFFKSPLDVALLTRRLERAMESNQIANSSGVVVVPDTYRLFLHPNDFDTYRKRHLRIEQELATYLTELARNRSFTTHKAITVLLASDPNVPRSVIRIDNNTNNQISPNDSTVDMDTIVLDDHNPTIVNTQPERYPTRHQHVLIVSTDNIVEHIPVTQTLITIGRAQQHHPTRPPGIAPSCQNQLQCPTFCHHRFGIAQWHICQRDAINQRASHHHRRKRRHYHFKLHLAHPSGDA